MAYLLLTFDLEEFVIPKEQHGDYNENELFRISYDGTLNIVELLNKYKISATFFTTYEFAYKYPDLIKKLIKKGHEIASHGYSHTHNYRNMKEEKSFTYLKKAKLFLENTFGIEIKGFRAPRLMKPKISLLKRVGFKYDSSLHPTFMPQNYFNLFRTRNITKKEDVVEIPISVTPLLHFPFSWFWFRNLGLHYSKTCTILNLKNSDYINIYFHPWEFVNHNSRFKKILPNLIIRRCGDGFINTFDHYLTWCNSKGFKPVNVYKYLRDINKNEKILESGKPI